MSCREKGLFISLFAVFGRGRGATSARGPGMKRFRQSVVVIMGLLPAMAAPDASMDSLRGEAYADLGQIVKGHDEKQGDLKGQYLSRLGVTITAIDTVKERLAITVGVGGMFWQPFPTYATTFWKSNLQFGP